jgi:hypothetical protein
MLDAVVEQHLAIGLADLRSLVADDRAIEPEPLRPRESARKWASCARDDSDVRADDPCQSLYIARIEIELGIEDRPVEV